MSRLGPSTRYRRTLPWTSCSTCCRAPGSPPRSASGRSCRCCWPARSRRPNVGLDFDGTELRVPGGVAVPARRARRWSRARARRSAAGADLDAGASCGCCSRVAVVLGALSRRRLARRPRPSDRARHRRAAPPPPRSASSRRGRCSRASAGGSIPRRRRALPVYGEGAALAAAGLSILFPPLAILVIAGARVAARGRPPARRREVRRPAHPLAVTKKLVLVVIDAMKPAMLERTVVERARADAEALIERGQHVDDCVAAFPSVTPVCAASIATGTGPDQHEIPAMNWYHRGEGRYIEYGTSFRASQAFGLKQSLTDTIYNMNLEHLSKDVQTVFERLDDADMRTAGTTYLMYRGRHRHEVSGDTALTRIAVDDLPPRGVRPEGALLRRHLRLAQDAVPLAARPAGHPRPALRLRRRVHGRARPVRLPALLAARQRHAFAQERAVRPGRLAGRRRPAARAADGARRRAGRVPRGPRGDRLLGPLAVARGEGDRPVPRVRRLRRAAGGARARRATPRSPCARTRAPRRCTCSTATAARAALRGSRRRCSSSRASTSC